jgi:ssDNA-binding Zn-finger/Zn-ribbon topoisomerase 1
MPELETKKKRRKKQQLAVAEVQEESQVSELVQVLDELEKQGKRVDIQVCPKCKSAKVRRVKAMGGDLWSHMGILPPKFECPECGWNARLVLKATNKPLTVRDVELIAEANESEGESK